MYSLRNRIALAIMLVMSLVLSGFISLGYSQLTQNFVLPCNITTFGNAWEGEFVFGLWNANSTTGQTDSYLVVISSNGSIEYVRHTNQISYLVAKNIAQDTLLFQGEPYLGGPNIAPLLATHIWNYATNVTLDFPNVAGHHDIEYNPINNTFLTLNDYVAYVNDTPILFDKIVEVDVNGTILWSWDTFDHIPLSDGDPFNPTATVNGITVQDFTHANALDWDYNHSIVYLNVRHTNTFYKIDQNTGNILWACGEHGNFTLLGDNGTVANSLWYHSHGTKQIAPNVFTMFDNDYDNETNPNDCYSRMIEVTLDEQNMTARTTWSWAAPRQYWSPALGKTQRLPNGDRIGTFGTSTHYYPQNQPWDFNNTGAVLIEVDQVGNVVRTFTFAQGWNIYRCETILYPTSAPPVIPELPLQTILALLMIAALLTIFASKRVL